MTKLLVLIALARAASAQDLATQDDAQITEMITAITQDPAIKVDDEKARAAAAALMTEGVRRLQVQAYDQALANFLEAYNRFPSTKNPARHRFDIAKTWVGFADAANTYQRYLADPATGADRVQEVKQLLLKLDLAADDPHRST